MFTRPLGMSVHQLLWYLLAIVSFSNFFSYEDLQKSRKRTLVTLNQQMTDITVELLLWLVVQPKCRSSNKWLPVTNLGYYESLSSSSVILQATMSLSSLYNPHPRLVVPVDYPPSLDPQYPQVFNHTIHSPNLGLSAVLLQVWNWWFFWVFNFCPFFIGALPTETFLL
jgi:hypothetical protein